MSYSRPWMFAGLTLMATGAILLWQQDRQPVAQAEPPKNSAEDPSSWKELFDGKTLKGWKATQFGGEGEVHVDQGTIVMDLGSMMTGITWAGKPPVRDNYELQLEGMRLEGSDFFCTTTFPVGKEFCSLVVGGWGGSLVGLSSINGMDASENSTTNSMNFKNNRWYRVRIRVSQSAIEAWIDDQIMVKQPRDYHQFGTRMEVDPCRPLGIATWTTKGAVRNIRVRLLKPDEIRALREREKAEAADN